MFRKRSVCDCDSHQGPVAVSSVSLQLQWPDRTCEILTGSFMIPIPQLWFTVKLEIVGESLLEYLLMFLAHRMLLIVKKVAYLAREKLLKARLNRLDLFFMMLN